jgi:hypothetical protein
MQDCKVIAIANQKGEIGKTTTTFNLGVALAKQGKKVLYITITSKTSEQMSKEYSFNELQMKQYNELLSNEYSSLWNGIIYGIDSGEYTTWRQSGLVGLI